jgi:hypothetical protein
MGHRAGLDVMEKWKLLNLPGLDLRTLHRSTLSQSLYRLLYLSRIYEYIYYISFGCVLC